MKTEPLKLDKLGTSSKKKERNCKAASDVKKGENEDKEVMSVTCNGNRRHPSVLPASCNTTVRQS